MNTISGSSSYSASASTNKGLSGLASGIDTESMVEQMLAGTQSKIDKQTGEKQTLTWKQDMYRDIISSLNKFQTKFFDYTSPTNMRSSAFYNAMSALSKSSALKATASSTAPTGKTTVQVAQLATNTNLKSAETVSGEMEGKIDTTQFEGKVTFDVDGTSTEINLTQVLDDALLAEQAKDPNIKALSEEQKQTAITDAINTISGVTAEISKETGAISIKSNKTVRVSSKSNQLGLNMLGLSANKANNPETGLMYGTLHSDAAVTVDISLDNIKKTITLERKADGSLDTDKFQKDLDKEFGKDQIKITSNGGNISFKTTDIGREVSVGGNKSGLDTIGMVSGQSDKISGGLKLKDISFKKSMVGSTEIGGKLDGDTFAFNINGKDFVFSGEDTLNSVMSKINNSGAGVTVKYLDLEDKFVMESSATGKGHSIEMNQTSGDLLGAMFGVGTVKGGNSVASGALVEKTIEGDPNAWKAVSDKDSMMSMVVNGKLYRIPVDKKDGASQADTEKSINESLQRSFGYASNGDPAIQIVGGNLKVNNGAVVSFDDAKIAELDKTYKPADNLAARLGFTGKDNYASETSKLSDLGIPIPAGVGADATVADLKTYLNNNSGGKYTVDFADGRIFMTKPASDPPLSLEMQGDTMQYLFGSDSIELGYGNDSYVTDQKAGQNAVISINGVATERSSNIFTTNGIQFDLQETTGDYAKDANGEFLKNADGSLQIEAGKTEQKAVVEISRDTEKIFEGLKSFVEEYNKIIENLNSQVDEKAKYRDYPPLTEAQKKDMSENEINLWEKNAKTGLLRNDTEITSLLDSMRSSLYMTPEGSKLSLYDIGIETSSNWKDKGKLVIDESKLKQMLESDAKSIEVLFTNTNEGGGLTQKLTEAIDKAAKISSGDPGSLVSLAGVVGRATEFSNTLTDRMKTIDDKLKTLKNKYASEKNRYWKQFNSMEKMMANLNTQSSWLTQQFS